MKKIFGLIVVFFLVVVVTGCSNEKTLTCTGETDGNNMKAGINVKYTFKDNKLAKSKFVMTVKDITLPNLKDNWDSLKEQFSSQNYPVNEKGYVRKTTVDDKKYEYSIYIDVDYTKISKDTMKKYGVDASYKNMTYKEIKSKAKSEISQVKCK